MLVDFGLPLSTMKISTDNQASLSLLKNGAVSPATKHIAVVYHAVRNSVVDGHVEFKHISTNDMVADFLTKSLPRPKFEYCLSQFGMAPPSVTS